MPNLKVIGLKIMPFFAKELRGCTAKNRFRTVFRFFLAPISGFALCAVPQNVCSVVKKIKKGELIMTTYQKRKLLEGTEKVCAYCGISEEECADFFGKNRKFSRFGRRGFHLEVDKLDPEKGYVKGNVCWACYPCNNSKSNYCNAKEFEPIGNGIRNFWIQKGYKPKAKGEFE